MFTKTKQCPVCKSANITLYSGGITGTYECKKCGYTGVFVTELMPSKRKGKKNNQK